MKKNWALEANRPDRTMKINSVLSGFFQKNKANGIETIEMPAEYHTIKCNSEKVFERCFWIIVEEAPKQTPKKAIKATNWIKDFSGEKINKIDAKPIAITTQRLIVCFSNKKK